MIFKTVKSRPTKLKLIGLFGIGILTACGPEALPKHAPERDVGVSIERAEKAAAEAREAERAATLKLQESNRQLEQAHQYLERAEAAANLCKGNYNRVVANEAAKKKAEVVAKKRAIAVAAAKKKEDELKAKAEAEAKALADANPPPKKEPEYSKSDAP